MHEIISSILGAMFFYPPLHLLGAAMLAFVYLVKEREVNEYKVPKVYALFWIVVTGLPGYLTVGNVENGIFWRHIRSRMDSDRTNAYDIADCKANIRRLKKLPKTDEVYAAICVEEQRLKKLRSYDKEVEAEIGLELLAPDLAGHEIDDGSSDS